MSVLPVSIGYSTGIHGCKSYKLSFGIKNTWNYNRNEATHLNQHHWLSVANIYQTNYPKGHAPTVTTRPRSNSYPKAFAKRPRSKGFLGGSLIPPRRRLANRPIVWNSNLCTISIRYKESLCENQLDRKRPDS